MVAAQTSTLLRCTGLGSCVAQLWGCPSSAWLPLDKLGLFHVSLGVVLPTGVPFLSTFNTGGFSNHQNCCQSCSLRVFSANSVFAREKRALPAWSCTCGNFGQQTMDRRTAQLWSRPIMHQHPTGESITTHRRQSPFPKVTTLLHSPTDGPLEHVLYCGRAPLFRRVLCTAQWGKGLAY